MVLIPCRENSITTIEYAMVAFPMSCERAINEFSKSIDKNFIKKVASDTNEHRLIVRASKVKDMWAEFIAYCFHFLSYVSGGYTQNHVNTRRVVSNGSILLRKKSRIPNKFLIAFFSHRSYQIMVSITSERVENQSLSGMNFWCTLE